MESMLAEQHYLRNPLRPFAEMDSHNNNLSLEEKAILAARSQLFLRAAAAAAGPYGPLMGSIYGAGASQAGAVPPGMYKKHNLIYPTIYCALIKGHAL